jgi:glycosyltransferase involved in cell wall biosynthesis
MDINEIKILYVGRLGYRKGILDLIKSAKFVTEKYKNIKFIIIGKGQIENELKNIVNKMDLDQYFNFLGFVDKEKLIDYYHKSAIFILPSYYEGLPTTLIEAMACGMPSIATRVDGVPELIQNGENGVFIPKKSPQHIAKAIIKLLDEDYLREKIGRNASITIQEKFSWEVISENILNIYENTLETLNKDSSSR